MHQPSPAQFMLRLRRTDHDVRVEMTPLMDVIFLLLTFFIYAMVLMVPTAFLPAKMQEFSAGEPAAPEPAITLSIDGAGVIRFDGEPVELDDVIDRLRQRMQTEPRSVVYLAAEEHGVSDRLPVFLQLYDRLAFAGLNIKLVGMPPQPPAGGR